MKVIIGRSAYGLEGVSNVDPVCKGLECASAVKKGVYQIAVISHFMLERSAQLTWFPMLWAVRDRMFVDFKVGPPVT